MHVQPVPQIPMLTLHNYIALLRQYTLHATVTFSLLCSLFSRTKFTSTLHFSAHSQQLYTFM